MLDIYGTIGPSCSDERTLEKMFAEGMTGIRINLSHVALCDCIEKINMIHSAADKCKVSPKILIDMQGPELRIGRVESPIALNEGDTVDLCKDGVELSDNSGMCIPKNRRIVIPEEVLPHLKPEMEVLLDDGKILVTVEKIYETSAEAKVRRGGILTSRKSIAR